MIKNKTQIAWRYAFAVSVILLGLMLIYLKMGNNFMGGFSSVGAWLVYVGFVMLAIVTLQSMSKKKRIVDERMQFIGSKAMGITYLAVIMTAFVVMVIDGIKTITIPYSYFMSYFVCGIVLVYAISYNILSKYY